MKLSNKFSPGYIDQIFTLWYTRGKPSPPTLYDIIPVDEFTMEKPHVHSIREWTKTDEWIARTEEWDFVTEKNLREKSAAAKVEMLERHAEIGREMQRMGFQWLKENEEKLTAGTALRTLIEGIEIEQGSVGIPDAIKKMQKMDDEKLLQEISQIISDSESDIDAYN